MQKQPDKAGYNIQVTKVVDIGGGHESYTLNTHIGPDASPEAIHGKYKVMRAAQQKAIDYNRELERRRAEQEHEQYEKMMHAQGTRSPVDLPDADALLAQKNGHAEQ